jgi:hypothetical protein
MNTKYVLISTLLLTFAFQVNGQLTVNAGRDTTSCMCRDTIQLGGNPTAWGGKEPYIYTWELMPIYYYDYLILASDLLIDSTSVNPIIDCGDLINDTVTFILTVTDADLNSKKDSVNIIISSIAWVHLMYFRPTINQGDSVQLKPLNIYNGIAPFTYKWTPETGLSNPIIRNPYAKPDTSLRYTCLVTDAIGCSAKDINDVVVIPTGISELTNSTYSSTVYPNPIASNSIIKTSNPLNEKRRIKVFNLNGQVLFEDWFYSDNYNIGKEINQNGFYYFIIKNDKEILTTGKFIKK